MAKKQRKVNGLVFTYFLTIFWPCYFSDKYDLRRHDISDNACANEEILRKLITEEKFNQNREISLTNTLRISVNKTKTFL